MDDLRLSKNLVEEMLKKTKAAEVLCLEQIATLRELGIELAHITTSTLVMMRTTVDAMMSITSAGTIISWNDAAENLFGYSEEEILGENISILTPERFRQEYVEKLKSIASQKIDERSGIKVETIRVAKDGKEIPVEMSVSPWDTDKGIFFTAIIRGISERKNNELAAVAYVKQLEEALSSTVDVITTISEMRDPYTTGHERRVAAIAVAIGAELGLDENTLAGISIAGHVHDVGKMSIPAEILSKPGKLTPIEFQLIRQHSQSSYDILKDIKFKWPVALIALQHHERFNGSGYPQGLKGDEILLEARIMAVADVIEAMSSHRPYRPGFGIDAALKEIESGAGILYDQEVVKVCLSLFRDKGFTIPL